MSMILAGPLFQEDPEDEVGSDPKGGGMDEIGTDKDEPSDDASD